MPRNRPRHRPRLERMVRLLRANDQQPSPHRGSRLISPVSPRIKLIPEALCLWEKHGSKLAFPAGFEECFRGKERNLSVGCTSSQICRIDSAIIRLLKINTVAARTCPPTFGSQGSQATLPDESEARVTG